MKKTWVKRNEIYPKPFYKQKFKMLLIFIFVLGIVFIIYNFLSINELSRSRTPLEVVEKTPTAQNNASPSEEHVTIMRGIRLFDFDAYKPNYEGNFKCLDDSKEIPFSRVNDNYCDCEDGTDEPSTNACNNGKFYCKYQKRHLTGRGQHFFIPSSRTNDGICDCCDGSDEWVIAFCKNTCLV